MSDNVQNWPPFIQRNPYALRQLLQRKCCGFLGGQGGYNSYYRQQVVFTFRFFPLSFFRESLKTSTQSPNQLFKEKELLT